MGESDDYEGLIEIQLGWNSDHPNDIKFTTFSSHHRKVIHYIMKCNSSRCNVY